MFEEEGYKLMGAVFEVYNEIGYGLAEEIYQQSLEIELGMRGIPFLAKQGRKRGRKRGQGGKGVRTH